MNRNVKANLYAHAKDMGGTSVLQPFPGNQLEYVDPFLLLHHLDIQYPEGVLAHKEGVDPHPHRGFSPVSFIFKGGIHHRDSRMNRGVVYEGGTQWMHAGMGIVHSERPPHDLTKYGNRQEMIQLWINSPAKNKMDQPYYIPLNAEDTPYIFSEDRHIRMNIVSGELMGIKGPISGLSPVNTATLYFQKGGKIIIPLPQDHNAFIYILDGKLRIEDFGWVDGHHAVVFENDGDVITLEALEDTRILLASGLPLNEKAVTHGPFVMNTQTQIMEAFRDYQMGKMGILIEE